MREHLILTALWLVYVVLHTLLAARSPKAFIERRWPRLLKYYRLFYNLFATAAAAAVIHYQRLIAAKPYYVAPSAVLYTGYGFMVLGFVIIVVTFLYYPFTEFAGIDMLMQKQPVKSDRLIVRGITKRVRHPLYLGVFLISWGWFAATPDLANLIMAIIFTLYIYIGLRIEEQKLIEEFGDAYREYRKKTPFLFPGFGKCTSSPTAFNGEESRLQSKKT